MKTNIIRTLSFVTLLVWFQTLHAAQLNDISRSIFKLFVSSQAWNLAQPWTKQPMGRNTCSGFVIEQGILTNAHCVTDATYIQLEIPGAGNKVDAELVAVNHQIDLALIKPVEPDILDDFTPISFGGLPEFREKVVTVGYPMGGRQVSYTEGVVSRIDIMAYAHSSLPSLMVQTDAAINPGNSGGPVFSDRTGECLGVATQKQTSGEGLGYFIPTVMVRHFLKDIQDNHIEGIPSLGVYYQPMENPALRKALKLKDDESGVRAYKIAKESSADGLLEIDDILMEIDGHNIFNDGRVPFRENGKIGLSYYISSRQVGEILPVTISRKGKRMNLDIPLKRHNTTVIPAMAKYDQPPRYYEIGGLVFQIVEPRYLWMWGNNWPKKIPIGLASYLNTPYGEEGLKELVVVSRVFNASVNKGYDGGILNTRVTKINGKDIYQLDDIIEAFKIKKRFHKIELENGVEAVLDRKQLELQEDSIRERYNIR
ncbi:MAG: serine protease [Gammaproteobacteria bacterium]|nr:MAG: serine protease [Gammaproteobacteria bacterium]